MSTGGNHQRTIDTVQNISQRLGGGAIVQVWLQKSDFSTEDLDLLDIESIDQYMRSLNMQALDRSMRNSMDLDEDFFASDFCAWGLGVNFDNGGLVHIYRTDSVDDKFDVLVGIPKNKKLFGLIPYTTNKETVYENLDLDQALARLRTAKSQMGE